MTDAKMIAIGRQLTTTNITSYITLFGKKLSMVGIDCMEAGTTKIKPQTLQGAYPELIGIAGGSLSVRPSR